MTRGEEDEEEPRVAPGKAPVLQDNAAGHDIIVLNAKRTLVLEVGISSCECLLEWVFPLAMTIARSHGGPEAPNESTASDSVEKGGASQVTGACPNLRGKRCGGRR